MKISANFRVSMHYQVTTEQGNIVESTFDGLPFVYLHGAGEIIPAMEEALEGVEEGSVIKINIPAAKAWGERDESLQEVVPRESLAHIEDLAAGQQYQLPEEDGSVQIISILDVNENTVTVDANHPLAGKNLTYEIKVLTVEPA